MNYVKLSFGEEVESQASGSALRARIALGAAEGGAVIVEVGESGGAAGKGGGAARKEAEAQKIELEARKKELEGCKKELEADVKRLEARRDELRAGARERGIGDEGSLRAPGGRPAEGARRIADGNGKRPGANEEGQERAGRASSRSNAGLTAGRQGKAFRGRGAFLFFRRRSHPSEVSTGRSPQTRMSLPASCPPPKCLSGRPGVPRRGTLFPPSIGAKRDGGG